jgi:hypothetical protein
MMGRYRLFKQVAGTPYFADVEVELSWVLSSGPSIDLSMTSPAPPRGWLFAAERGARDAVEALDASSPRDGRCVRVQIVRLTTTFADTTEDSVYAASYLAVVDAAGAQARFELYRDTEWRVRLRT